MGPQPWELRKPMPSSSNTVSSGSFNGAAALGAAETWHDPPGAPPLVGFNGAAALGAAETAIALHAVNTGSCKDLCESSSFGALPNPTEARSEQPSAV